jgi:hypothetical protein
LNILLLRYNNHANVKFEAAARLVVQIFGLLSVFLSAITNSNVWGCGLKAKHCTSILI